MRRRAFWIISGLLCLPILTAIVLIAWQIRHQRLDNNLIGAIKNNDTPTVMAMLKQGASANALDQPGEPMTARRLLDRLMQRLHRKNQIEPRPNYPSALLVATEWQYEDFTHHGMRANHVPANESSTNVKIVKALLQAGAQTEVENAEGYTPLALAAWQGKHENVDLLLRHGAKVYAVKNRLGWSPLMLAGVACNTKVVRLLLAAHADANYHAVDNLTPLFIAKAHDGKEAVRLLIQAGAKD